MLYSVTLFIATICVVCVTPACLPACLSSQERRKASERQLAERSALKAQRRSIDALPAVRQQLEEELQDKVGGWVAGRGGVGRVEGGPGAEAKQA